jgi:monomeric sarcosine oxidase
MSQARHYDVAVLGLGSMGTFAALDVLERGHSVIGFDQFAPPHHHGSHGGHSRVYRVAYPEGSAYVPLAIAAGALWDDLGRRLHARLLHRTGMLHMGAPESTFIRDVAECAAAHQLKIALLGAEEVRRQFPAFRIPDHYVGMLDPEAGWIDVDAALVQTQNEMLRLGATIRKNTQVLGWKAEGDSITVTTAEGDYHASRLLITAGAWAHDLLRELQLPLTIRRKVLTWFAPYRPDAFAGQTTPVFTFPENWIYGFPPSGAHGVKLAEHLGGDTVPRAGSAIAPPGASDIDPIRETIRKHLPSLCGPPPDMAMKLLHAQVCLYTLTPDENFIIDRHPEHAAVVFAAGFSGHGFKFAPLIGKLLARLSLDSGAPSEIEFLRLSRFERNANLL